MKKYDSEEFDKFYCAAEPGDAQFMTTLLDSLAKYHKDYTEMQERISAAQLTDAEKDLARRLLKSGSISPVIACVSAVNYLLDKYHAGEVSCAADEDLIEFCGFAAEYRKKK
ncbi:MAG: hypothetical protein IJI14_20790 [Anaerolineaceae bacterium]|nr:hypothetical protein [Anaerolineaceae bacterium]